MLRRLTAALSTLLLLQFTLPGTAEMCMRHGAADPAMAAMMGTGHLPQGAPEHGVQGNMSHSAASTMQGAAGSRSDAIGEHAGNEDDGPPCHAPGAARICATMPACASVAALPVAAPRTDASRVQLAVALPSESATPTPGAAPEPPPPRA